MLIGRQVGFVDGSSLGTPITEPHEVSSAPRELPSRRPDISVVVPVLNERETIAELCRRLHAVLGEVAGRYEIIFIDDGSTDGTIDEIRRHREPDERVRYVRFRTNFGKSAALAAGFRAARYELIATLDGDLQDLPEELPRLVTRLQEGCDVVSGWRQHRRDRFSRKIASKLYNRATSWLTGVRLHDINCGLKCYRREVLNEVTVYGERHRFIPVLASHRGFQLAEVQVDHAPRAHGKSRYGIERALAGGFSLLSIILLTRYTTKPLHFFGLLGLGLAGMGSAMAGYLVVTRIFFQQWLSNRPLLTISAVFIIVGVYFVLFGLLAEMIAFSYRREDDYSIQDSSEDSTPRSE